MDKAIELLEDALTLVGQIKGDNEAVAGRAHWRIASALELLRNLIDSNRETGIG